MIDASTTYTVSDTYSYECSCGERFNSADAAYNCRKCRNYCVFGYCTHVVDTRNATVVRGEEPTAEQWEEATIRAEARWAEEARELEAMIEAEKERRDDARAEWDAARERERVEMDEDEMWDMQDSFTK